MENICTKHGEWWKEQTEESCDPQYMRMLEDLGLLELVTKVVSHNRFLIYKIKPFDKNEIIELLQTVPYAKRVIDFENSGWKKSKASVEGGYYSGSQRRNSITKGPINWVYYYVENLDDYQEKAFKYIKILKEHVE